MNTETTMTQQEASAKISSLIAEATAKINEAENISETYGISFGWNGCGYGMGGYYQPTKEKDSDGEWEESSSESGWQASSQGC